MAGARCTTAILIIAACARPSAPPAATAPAAHNRNAISTVAFAGDVVVALTEEGRLRVWNGDATPMRALDLEHVAVLAEDGSVAVTGVEEGKQGGARLDVWALPSLTHLHSRSFEHGVREVLAASARAAVLKVNTGYRGDPNSEPSVPPPRWYGGLWTFATDAERMRQDFRRCDEAVAFSADGRRVVCRGEFSEITWIDLESGRYSSPQLALDWLPRAPARAEDEEEEIRPNPHRVLPRPPYFILSLRPSANGDDVYVTYRRTGEGDEHPTGWRLERWTPMPRADSGPVARIAASHADANTRLLAVSPDGGVLVLADPLMVRRGPRYGVQELAASGTMAAAFSPDGKRFVSGHADGTLKIWDAGTGRLLATSPPSAAPARESAAPPPRPSTSAGRAAAPR